MPEEEKSDLDIILPEPGEAILKSGKVLKIRRLKARQFFALVRIITRGASQLLYLLQTAKPEQYVEQMMSILFFAIPEAENEVFEFLVSVVEMPEDEEEANLIRMQLTVDPEIEDIAAVAGAVVLNEKDDVAALGKALTRAFGIAEKTGQIQKPETPPLVDLPEPSTLSRVSTVGETTKS